MVTGVPVTILLAAITLGPVDAGGCAHQVLADGAALTGGPVELCIREAIQISLDGEPLIALRVDAPHRFEPRVRSRVFLYRVAAGRLVPRFLGSGFTTREVKRLFTLDRALGLETTTSTGQTETLRCVFDGFPLVCAPPIPTK